jgi:hypothetical protein
MADEPEDPDDELGKLEVEEESPYDYVQCEKGEVIFPHGMAWYADTHGFNRIFVDYKSADVTGEDNETGLMRKPTRKGASLRSIKAENKPG